MTLVLKQSTSIDIRMGPFVDATNGVTPETGVTLAGADQAEVLKANGAATVAMGGTFAAVTGADGWYDYTVAAGDVDTVGEVVFVVQDADVCLPVMVRGYVVEEAIYDALYAASAAGFDANGRVDVGEWLGTAVTATTAGVPNVNTTEVSGDSAAADNLEADYDGTGYAKTASTIGTATTVTNDVGVNEWNGVALGTTNPLPNAAAGAAGGLPTDSTGKTSFNDVSISQVNAEVVDVINTDTSGEPAQGAPAATASLRTKIDYIYKFLRNKKTADSSTISIYDDAGTTVDHKRTISDDGTTYTEGEVVAGP